MNDKEKLRVIGITGGIASGKTVATSALRSAGYNIIDADEISRSVTAAGTPVERELMRMFPSCTENGRLDRRKLRALISSDGSAMEALNDYTHPLITAEIENMLSAAPKPVVLSAPLLFETALSALCDATVCVVCPKAKRTARLMSRDDVDEHDAAAIIDAQIPDCIRAAVADYVVSSDCDETTFKRRVLELFEKLM